MPAIDRSVVADVPLFAGVAASEFDEVLREAHSVRYPKGAAVFEQGSEATSLLVLLHGHLRVEQSAQQGHQIVVRYVSPGEIFGVAQALALTRYPAAALAVVDSVVLCWPSAAWSRLSAKFPALAANALQTVGRRLQENADAHPGDVKRAGRAARRACAVARGQASGAQDGIGDRDRFSDQPAGCRGDDRHDATYGEPHPQHVGAAGARRGRTPADRVARAS